VTDGALHRVHVIDTLGRYVAGFGRKGQGPGEFALPHAVAVGGGRIFVSDLSLPRVQIFDMDGEYTGRVDLRDPECLPGSVIRLAGLSDGVVGLQRCLVDSTFAHRLVHLGPAGDVSAVHVTVPEPTSAFLPAPVLASDGARTVAVGDGQQGCLTVFELGESGRVVCPRVARRPISDQRRERMERLLDRPRSPLRTRVPDSLPAFDDVALDSVIFVHRPTETGAGAWFRSSDGFRAPGVPHPAEVRTIRRRGRHLNVMEATLGIMISLDPGAGR